MEQPGFVRLLALQRDVLVVRTIVTIYAENVSRWKIKWHAGGGTSEL